MRRGNVDKVARKKTGAGGGFDDALSANASGTAGMGFGTAGSGKPDGLMPLKSPSSAMGDALKRTQSGKSKQPPLTPLGMKGSAAK